MSVRSNEDLLKELGLTPVSAGFGEHIIDCANELEYKAIRNSLKDTFDGHRHLRAKSGLGVYHNDQLDVTFQDGRAVEVTHTYGRPHVLGTYAGTMLLKSRTLRIEQNEDVAAIRMVSVKAVFGQLGEPTELRATPYEAGEYPQTFVDTYGVCIPWQEDALVVKDHDRYERTKQYLSLVGQSIANGFRLDLLYADPVDPKLPLADLEPAGVELLGY